MTSPLLLRGRVLPVLEPPIPHGAVVIEDGVVTYVGPAARPAPGPRRHRARRRRRHDHPGHGRRPRAPGGRRLGGLHGLGGPGDAGRSRTHRRRQRRAHADGRHRRGARPGAPGGIAIALGRAIAGGRQSGPEVAAAGRALTAPGGHIPYLGVEVQGVAEMVDAARTELDRGADGIKLVATGGVLTPAVAIGNAPYEEAELRAAAAVARDVGRWVAAHAIGHEGTKRALRAGATSIEHGVYLDEEAIELMGSADAVLVTTRIAVVRMLRRRDVVEPAVVAKAEEIQDVTVESLRRAARAGIPIAGASDAGTPFNPHGGVAEEAALLVRDIGLSTEDALRAVTATAARCLLRPDLGHLSVGATGHVVVLGGDPLDDIGALTDVRSVVIAGRPVAPPAVTGKELA